MCVEGVWDLYGGGAGAGALGRGQARAPVCGKGAVLEPVQRVGVDRMTDRHD